MQDDAPDIVARGCDWPEGCRSEFDTATRKGAPETPGWTRNRLLDIVLCPVHAPLGHGIGATPCGPGSAMWMLACQCGTRGALRCGRDDLDALAVEWGRHVRAAFEAEAG